MNQIKDYITYTSDKVADKTFLGTLGNGITVIDNHGLYEAILDDKVGIKDHICSSLKEVDKLVFGTLTTGMLALEYSNPLRKFGEESGLVSFISDMVSYNNILFIATDDGVYYKDFSRKMNDFQKIVNENLQVFSLAIYKDSIEENNNLIVGTTQGLYEFNHKTLKIKSIERKIIDINKLFSAELSNKELENILLYVYKLYFSNHSNELWIGTADRVFTLKKKGENWIIGESVYNTGSRVYNIVELDNGNLWLSTVQGDLFEIEVAQKKLISKNYILKNKDNGIIPLKLINNKLTIILKNGIYHIVSDSLVKFNVKNAIEVLNVFQLSNNQILINTKYGKGSLSMFNSSDELIKKFLNRLQNIKTETFHEFKNHLWFTNGSTLYNFPLDAEFEMDSVYHCLVRKVEGYDSVYFNGTYYKDSDVGRIPSMVQHENQKPILDYAYNDLTFHYSAPFFEGVEHIEYSYRLNGFKENWSNWDKEPKAVFTNLNEGQYTFQVKAKNVYDIESTIGEYAFTILPPWYRTILAYIIYAILGIVALYVFVKLYTRRLQKEKEWLEGVVRERTAEIREQRDEIQEQKQSIEDSIHYASRIQKAILPSDEMAECILPEHFILFRPRDVVSGDYYWMNKIGDKVVLIAADCTGHGVPGAFMSMLGVSFLNEIVLKENTIEPHKILNKLRARVKNTLKQEGKEGEAKDGMDVALVVFDQTQNKLYFAGAYNPVLIYRGEELIELKADRMPIGIYIKEKESFTLNEFDYEPGDTFYIFSDGYPDQFGGPKGSKFRIKAMKQLILDLQSKPMAEQKEILNTTIEAWMAETPGQEQIDDMVLIGVRL